MKCPRCDTIITDDAPVCRFCGQDLRMMHHARKLSNAYYNMGLEKAKVRDLSGAILVLKKSLSFNKHNTDARNLLGLVYNEMGETIAALSEWVLSDYFQPEENRAKYYINVVQKNQSTLQTVNQTIKKYNLALKEAKNENEDVAIIQLKKVVSLNPKFVRAYQLLALLYMKRKDYVKAAKTLKHARKIDFNNTTTLRYMQEIGDTFSEPRGKDNSPKAFAKQAERERQANIANVTPVGTYREEKKHWLPAVNIVVGAIIGIVISVVLIYPTIKGDTLGNNSSDITEAKQMVSVKEAQISTLEREKKALQEKADALQKTIKDKDTEKSAEVEKLNQLLVAVKYYQEGERLLAASEVNGYKASDFTTQEAKDLLAVVAKEITAADAQRLFEDGRKAFNSGKYDNAEKLLKQVLSVDDKNLDALYFMGRVYHQTGKNKKAQSYYEKVIATDKTSGRAAEARNRLKQLGVKTE
ncbi:MAG: tetratricopeptide repeat protein [Eubacterium sp.]